MAESINPTTSLHQAPLESVLDSLLTDITNVRSKLAGILDGSSVVDLAALTDATGTVNTLTVTGAALGDFVLVSASLSVAGMIVTGYVSSTNTVSVLVQNETGATLDLSSVTLRARVIPLATLTPTALATTT